MTALISVMDGDNSEAETVCNICGTSNKKNFSLLRDGNVGKGTK